MCKRIALQVAVGLYVFFVLKLIFVKEQPRYPRMRPYNTRPYDPREYYDPKTYNKKGNE